MARRELAARLKNQSTLRLVILSLISLGIYPAHYMYRQTNILNKFTNVDNISSKLVIAILALSYVNVALLIPDILFTMGDAMDLLISGLDFIWAILVLVWAFHSRHIMNTRFHATPGDTAWFNGFLAFLFTVFYFNYKVNQIENHYATKAAFNLPGR